MSTSYTAVGIHLYLRNKPMLNPYPSHPSRLRRLQQLRHHNHHARRHNSKDPRSLNGSPTSRNRLQRRKRHLLNRTTKPLKRLLRMLLNRRPKQLHIRRRYIHGLGPAGRLLPLRPSHRGREFLDRAAASVVDLHSW